MAAFVLLAPDLAAYDVFAHILSFILLAVFKWRQLFLVTFLLFFLVLAILSFQHLMLEKIFTALLFFFFADFVDLVKNFR